MPSHTYIDDELLDIARTLVAIPSVNPGGSESGVAEAIQDILGRAGITARIDISPEGRPNVLAEVPGTSPGKTLILNGHLDVVPPGDNWTVDPWAGICRNGRLYGRGAADMKGGIAAMIRAVIGLVRDGSPFAGKVVLLFNADEEYGNTGIRLYLKRPIPAEYTIIGEPTRLRPCYGHKGDCRVRIRTHGTAGHCALVENPDNALYKLARAMTALESLALSVARRSGNVGPASLSVNMAAGGEAPNIIPDSAWMEVDRRILPGEIKKEVLREIADVTRRAIGEEVDISCYLFFPAHYIAPDHPFVIRLAETAAEVTGRRRDPVLFPASTEAPFFSVNQEIPTVIIGPGNLEQAHVADEFVDLEQLEQASLLYRRAVLSLLHEEA